MTNSFREESLPAGPREQRVTISTWFPITSQVVAPMIAVLGPLGGKRVLDVCCGPGHLAAAIAAEGGVVEGVDFAAPMVARAQENYPKLEFRQGDAEALTHAEGRFITSSVRSG